MKVKSKYIIIAAFVIISAVLIVLCVSFFDSRQTTEFDGTLVEAYQLS